MGLFDSLKQQAVNALKTNGNKIGKEIGDNIKNSVKSISNKSEDIFPILNFLYIVFFYLFLLHLLYYNISYLLITFLLILLMLL